MGFTEKLPNGKYRARWYDPTGKQRSLTFDLERDAKKHVRNAQADIDRGVYVDDKAGRVTFGEWAEHFMAIAEKRLARTSFARDRSYLDNHVLPRWGKVKLGRITRVDVDKWIAELSEDGASVRKKGGSLSPATIEKIYQVFRKIMAAAYDDGRIGRLPCPEHPPIPRKKRKIVRFLDETQVVELGDQIHDRYEAMIYVGSYGGFRIGELCALRIDDIDWDRGHIRVDEGLTDVDGLVKFEDPKTERAFRTVPMADLALEHLRRHIDRLVDEDDSQALLFTSPEGGILRPTNWRARFFNPAVKAAKLTPLTPHDLRHTAASLFISAGANPWMLAEVLGHTDTRMIDRVYGHLFEKDREELRKRMSEKARTTPIPAAGTGNVIDLRGRRPSRTPR
ncbi:MAG: site-specific integrase [Acidimicrobiales bacterium]